MAKKTVTCSFVMDRDLYNSYKSVVVKTGETVKGNLVNYMALVAEQDQADPCKIRKNKSKSTVQSKTKNPKKEAKHNKDKSKPKIKDNNQPNLEDFLIDQAAENPEKDDRKTDNIHDEIEKIMGEIQL